MYLGSFVKVNFGALFPEVADAAVSLFLVLRVTKLIIFDIEKIKQERNEVFILYLYFKLYRVNSYKIVEIIQILKTKVTSLVKEFK